MLGIKRGARLQRFRNIHAGHAAFLLGNGPSVRIADLERLSGWITFGCNYLYKIYDQTTFRPTYTFMSDRQMIADNGRDVVAKSAGTVVLAAEDKPHIEGDFVWLPMQHRGNPEFDPNKLQRVTVGGGTLITAIQFGYYMGIRQFYLYGVDHSFKFTVDQYAKDSFRSAVGDDNHFIPNYRDGQRWCPPNTRLIEIYFQMCDQALRIQGGFVKNATWGGRLEVLERVGFDRVVERGGRRNAPASLGTIPADGPNLLPNGYFSFWDEKGPLDWLPQSKARLEKVRDPKVIGNVLRAQRHDEREQCVAQTFVSIDSTPVQRQRYVLVGRSRRHKGTGQARLRLVCRDGDNQQLGASRFVEIDCGEWKEFSVELDPPLAAMVVNPTLDVETQGDVFDFCELRLVVVD